ncbi:ribosomal-processing cysteine protease Prp [Sutcliffiella deserti]|uniref:ribosomal-processing cysteine protease Prp n=1 Tax=Sutcliffiella deserti TaxID=2875501 RepID=UPI001CBB297E|nr:ribosomal-processing cysteine protease Prp [Sutcliffiella deserti]
MIKVTLKRNDQQLIESFAISGHANFAKKGADIVCAGVSAVSFGTVNAIIALLSVTPDIEQGEDGFLRCSIPSDLEESTKEKIQLLLEGMVVSLETIERDYGNYITISK